MKAIWKDTVVAASNETIFIEGVIIMCHWRRLKANTCKPVKPFQLACGRYSQPPPVSD